MNSQLSIVTEFEGLYDPIVGATDGHGREAAATPELQLERTLKLREVYSELRTELLQDITAIEERIIRPATDARTFISPIRKTIKKRENKRLDYEKLQEKVTKLQRKPGRNPKEEASLAKYHDEMTRAADVSIYIFITYSRLDQWANHNPRNSVLLMSIFGRHCPLSSRQHSTWFLRF